MYTTERETLKIFGFRSWSPPAFRLSEFCKAGTWYHIRCWGVSRGFVLGPLLFLLMANALPAIFKDADFKEDFVILKDVPQTV